MSHEEQQQAREEHEGEENEPRRTEQGDPLSESHSLAQQEGEEVPYHPPRQPAQDPPEDEGDEDGEDPSGIR